MIVIKVTSGRLLRRRSARRRFPLLPGGAPKLLSARLPKPALEFNLGPGPDRVIAVAGDPAARVGAGGEGEHSRRAVVGYGGAPLADIARRSRHLHPAVREGSSASSIASRLWGTASTTTSPRGSCPFRRRLARSRSSGPPSDCRSCAVSTTSSSASSLTWGPRCGRKSDVRPRLRTPPPAPSSTAAT
jgi:hypothetical protein